jgi:hypothetical protein
MLASHSSPRRVVTELLLDAAGRRRSPARMPGFRAGRPPRNTGMRYPADPPTVEEIVAVMRAAGDRCTTGGDCEQARGQPRPRPSRRRSAPERPRCGARGVLPDPRLPSTRGVVLASLRPVGRLSALPLIVRCGIANCGAATLSSPCSERVGRVGQSAPRWTLGQSCCEVAGPWAARRRLQLAVGR